MLRRSCSQTVDGRSAGLSRKIGPSTFLGDIQEVKERRWRKPSPASCIWQSIPAPATSQCGKPSHAGLHTQTWLKATSAFLETTTWELLLVEMLTVQIVIYQLASQEGFRASLCCASVCIALVPVVQAVPLLRRPPPSLESRLVAVRCALSWAASIVKVMRTGASKAMLSIFRA